MWCDKCHYGNEDYSFDHCGQCGGTKMISKNPFVKSKKDKREKRPKQETKKQNASSTHDDVAAITSGKIKPTIMH